MQVASAAGQCRKMLEMAFWASIFQNFLEGMPPDAPSCLVPRLLISYARQLEVLVTALLGRISHTAEADLGFWERGVLSVSMSPHGGGGGGQGTRYARKF